MCLIHFPLDDTNPDDGRKTKVVYGVLTASGKHKGMFVVATGSPHIIYGWPNPCIPTYLTNKGGLQLPEITTVRQ